MNYDHAYHAGNFADVVKHATIARIVEYLKRKDTPFRVIDTHAGAGLHELTSERAQKTGEWRDGVQKVLTAKIPPDTEALLSPWLDCVRALNPACGQSGELALYPGSPELIRSLLRGHDRMTAIELEPKAHFTLKTRFAGDYQTRIIQLDGWLALGGHLPPKERRGLVIVDPPYEVENEFARILDGLQRAHARWPGGIYSFWYPVKDLAKVDNFRASLRALGIPKILDATQMVRRPLHFPRLDGTGMIVVNPPYTLEQELKTMLPVLCSILKQDDGASWSVEWLAGEASSA